MTGEFGTSYFGGVFDGLFFIMTIFLQNPFLGVRGLAGKVLYAGISFTGVILISAYTANLASLLTVATLTSQVKSVDDLPGKLVGIIGVCMTLF